MRINLSIDPVTYNLLVLYKNKNGIKSISAANAEILRLYLATKQRLTAEEEDEE